MRFLGLVQKNLLRRPMRSVLTLVALSTAIAAVVALIGVADGFTRSFAEIYKSHAVDIVVSRHGAGDRFSSTVDQSFVPQIEQLDSVDRAAAVLLETLSLEEEGVYAIPTMGIAAGSWLLDDFELVSSPDHDDGALGDADSATPGDQIDSTQGDSPESNEPRKTLMLGIHLAERLEKSVGQSLLLFDEEYKISGIFRSPSTWENGAMVLPLDQLQELTDRENQATYINVVLDRDQGMSAEDAKTSIQEIQALDARLQPLATDEFVETDTRMKAAGAMAWMTSAIALMIGAVGTLNTMLTSVMERTKEIGILRAIGWKKSRVIRMILLESCGLAILAGFIGTVLAMLLTWLLSQAPAAKGILSPSIGWPVVLQGLLLAVGIGLLGAILPAWRAAKMLPTEAFREG